MKNLTIVPAAILGLAFTLSAGAAHAGDVPPWMAGVYEGGNAKYRSHIHARIEPDGDIKWDVDQKGKHFTLRGRINPDTMRIQGKRYDVEHRGDTLVIRHIGESDDVTELHRVSRDRDERHGPRLDPDRRPGSPRPMWFVGVFTGRSGRDASMRLEIAPDGDATLTTNRPDGDRIVRTGTYRDGVLTIDGRQWELRRGDDGVRLKRVGDRRDAVLLHRE